jgi:hypothetical protein
MANDATTPGYTFTGKAKLARGFSYPIQRSRLDAFLTEADLRCITHLGYGGPSKDNTIISASYHPAWEALDVLICAVPSEHKSVLGRCVAEQCLPAFAEWIRRFADKSLLWAQLEHRFVARYQLSPDADRCEIRLEQN